MDNAPIVDPSTNPFYNRTPKLTPYNRFKFIFPGIILMPIRITMLVVCLLMEYIVCSIVTLGISKNKPLPGLRATILITITTRLDRAILFFLGFHWIKVKGTVPPIGKGARVIVCNHMSPWEGAILASMTGAGFVSRIENMRMPIVGTILQARRFVAVDREGGAAGVKAEIQNRVDDSRFPPVAIFPEGTTLNGTALISFRAGAFAPGAPVQPVCVKFVFQHIDPSWTGFEVGLTDLLFRLTSQWYNTAEVTFLPIYTPTEEEKANPILFGNNVRLVMAKELRVRVTDHTFEDMFLQSEAVKCHLDPNDAVLGMDRVRRVLHLSLDDVKGIMKKFAEMDKKQTGVVSYEAFLEAMGIPASVHARDAFATMIGSDADVIDFRAFVCATARLSTEFGTEDKIHIAFSTCDINKDGKIDEDELYVMLHLCSPATTRAQTKQLFKKIDTRKNGFLDQYEFANYMRENPTWLQLFHTTLADETARPSKALEKAWTLGRSNSVSSYLKAFDDEDKKTN